MKVTVTSKKEVRRGHCWHSTMLGPMMRCCQCGREGAQPTRYERDPAHGPHVEVLRLVVEPVIVYGPDPEAPCIPKLP